MAKIDVRCPGCRGVNVVKSGLTGEGKQRYRCNDSLCNRKTFILNYSYKGRLPEVKKESSFIKVDVVKVEEAELGEMWSFVKNKQNQRWLWHAIDHHSHTVLTYLFGPRKDTAFKALKEKLSQFDIDFFYTDDWGAYKRHLPKQKHLIGKRNTQAIERKHLTFKTRIKRLARKTICFSKLELVHYAVIGLFINLFEFGRLI